MNLRKISLAGIFAVLLMSSSLGARAQSTPSTSVPAPGHATPVQNQSLPAPSASVFFELTEARAGTPTIIEIPRKYLSNSPTPVAASLAFPGGPSGTSAIAAVALSAALSLGGLHFFRQKRRLKAPAVALTAIGLLALTASLVQGDIAPPSVRRPPTVAGHAVVKISEDGNAVRIVVSRELLTALLKQPPANGQK